MSGTIWSKFFWSDWLSDIALRKCSVPARGLWIDLLCVAAQHDPIGYLAVNNEPLSIKDMARISGISEGEAATLLGELERTGVLSRNRKGVIYNRRMVRDHEKSQTNRNNGKLGGNPSLCNSNRNVLSVNPPDKTPVIREDKPHMPESILPELRKKDSCRIASAMPTSIEEGKTGKQKPRLAYDSDFENFWALYPTTRNMSKKEAWDVWRRLSSDDRQLAKTAVPKYVEWLRGQGERAPAVIHACRFLSKRRFDGHAQSVENISPNQFYARFGSAELEAWDSYGRMMKGTTYPKDKRGGWSFPERWPPNFKLSGEIGA